MGFEPMSPLSQAKRLAGARTRPLCDPSLATYMLSNVLKPSNTLASHDPGERIAKGGVAKYKWWQAEVETCFGLHVLQKQPECMLII